MNKNTQKLKILIKLTCLFVTGKIIYLAVMAIKWKISEIYGEKIFHNEWNLLNSHPNWEIMSLDFSKPGEKKIRNSYKSGGRAGFDTCLFPPIYIAQFSFSYTGYFASNFEGVLPYCIHILVTLNKAVVSFYKKSHNTQLLRSSTICSPSRRFAGFQHIMFSENLCPKLRCGPSCGYCCVKD